MALAAAIEDALDVERGLLFALPDGRLAAPYTRVDDDRGDEQGLAA